MTARAVTPGAVALRKRTGAAPTPGTVALLALTVLTACTGERTYAWRGVDPATAHDVVVEPGSAPAPATWGGEWRSPQLGELELVQRGDAVTGSYAVERGRCVIRGVVHGEARGNLLTLRWWEDHADCGRSAPLSGRGFFLYTPHPRAPEVARLFGRWGYAWSDRAGGAWVAVRAP